MKNKLMFFFNKDNDLSNESARNKRRYRLASMSIMSNVISKGLAMTMTFASVTFTLPYLGSERFGIWMTIASFINILTILDLGIGNALTNRIAFLSSKNDIVILKKGISGGLSLLSLIGFISVFILVTMIEIVPWTNIVSLQYKSQYDELILACIVFSILFGFYILANGVVSVFKGLQLSFLNNIFSSFGSLLSILLLVFTSKNQMSISELIIMTFGVQVIFVLFSSVFLMKIIPFKKNELFSFSNMCGEYKSLLNVGVGFFIIQISMMVGWGADTLIISTFIGVAHVAIFSVTQRLFQLVSQPVTIINAPLWGAYADANARSDYKFIQMTLVKSLKLSTYYAVFMGGIIVVFNELIVKLLTDDVLVIPFSLIFIYYIWSVVVAVASTFSVYLNGVGVIKTQAIIAICFAIISTPLKIILLNKYSVEGVILSSLVVYLIVAVVPYVFIFRKNILHDR